MSNYSSIDLPLQLHRHPLVTQHSTAFLPVHPPCSHSRRYLSLHPSFLFYARPQVLEVSDPFNFLTKNIYLWSVSLGVLFERKVHELGIRSTDPHSPLFQGFLHDSRYAVMSTSLSPHNTMSSANSIDSGASFLTLSVSTSISMRKRSGLRQIPGVGQPQH